MRVFEVAEIITSMPLLTVAQIVAGPLGSPAGGVTIVQLELPVSFFSSVQPWPLSMSYSLFIKSSDSRVLMFGLGIFPPDIVNCSPRMAHEQARMPAWPGMSPSADLPACPTAALISAGVR